MTGRQRGQSQRLSGEWVFKSPDVPPLGGLLPQQRRILCPASHQVLGAHILVISSGLAHVRSEGARGRAIRRRAHVRHTSLFKLSSVTCAVLLCGIFAAQAYHSEDTYTDLVRPNGQPRSDTIFNADLNFCYRQTGASRMNADTPAFKQCMLGRQWKWDSAKTVREPSRSKGRPDCFDLSWECK